ncbi:extracellular solute-binding protein family 5 [Natrialba chahannaoensis JCM 10990]|uniref:Extracellular solute-binding protein family 5 n=1 Tax=Natrialba chahannaoensis JCM 10990 TaxID=1227492 RepID=M0A997_9EURY|nr:ABC transporter substrate-binding protein [Natrialba chahannaoensis]ELY95350.1 extracellular solute-binding protein family 5 [Natrialba chahannaoensis JCM 10990]
MGTNLHRLERDGTVSRRRLLGGIVSASIAGVAGCLTSDTADGSTLRIAKADPLNNEYQFFDGVILPHSPVAETLVYVDNEVQAEPWLATDWESSDARTWEFTLREGVQFHNGDELTAELLEEYFLAYEAERGLEVVDRGVQAVDDMVLQFELAEPNPKFPEETARHWMSVLHPDSTEEEVIATGPYQIEEHEIGSDFEAVRFDEYWGDQPGFERLELRDIQDDRTRRFELEAGNVDVAVEVSPDHVSAIEDDPELRVESFEQMRTFALWTNIYNSPTDDPDFRLALQHLIDQETFVEELLEDRYLPARGTIPPYVSWAAEDLPEYEHDMDRARELVEQSSYDGETVTIAVANRTINGDTFAEVFRDRLADVGVDTEVRMMEWSAYLDFTGSPENQLELGGASILDANVKGLLKRQYHSEGLLNLDLYRSEGTGMHNPGEAVDALIDAGIHDDDTDALREAQHRVREMTIGVPLFHDRIFVAMHEDVTGVEIAPVSNQAHWGNVAPTE